MGCASTDTQRGVTITGSRSTSARIISNDALPDRGAEFHHLSGTGMAAEHFANFVSTPEVNGE